MNRNKIENGLALLGALVVLIGVSAAASSAFAAGKTDVESRAIAIHDAGEAAISAARRENRRAADEAIRSIEMDNVTSLDIALADRTSTSTAGAR